MIIVGGGFGGLAAAQALEGAELDVVILDARNHHCFQPLLYQAATAALSTADIAWPLRHILRRQSNTTVLMAMVEGVDMAKQIVLSSAGAFGFDWLVLATGSTHSYFGHDGWERYAPALKTIDDALAVRSRVLTAFERAEASESQEERKRRLVFAIVGGGPTGSSSRARSRNSRGAPCGRNSVARTPAAARILLIEAGPRSLPSFPERLADYASRRLAGMGVEVRTGQP